MINLSIISLELAQASFRPSKHRFIKKWMYGVIIDVNWIFPIGVEDSETLIYIFHPDLNGNDIIALSYFAVNLFVILVSYISIYIKVLYSRHPQHHGAADLRERKLTITLFLVTLGSLLTILPTIICTTVFVFHIQLLLALSRGTFSTFFR